MVPNFKQKNDIPFYIEVTEEEYKLNKELGIIKENTMKLGSNIVPVVVSKLSVHSTFNHQEGEVNE